MPRIIASTSLQRFSQEISQGVKRSENILKQVALEGLRQELDQMAPRLRQVINQTKARIFDGNTRPEGKLLSVFEPSTEVIRKGKAGKPMRTSGICRVAGRPARRCGVPTPI
jgi:transposase, IS5 family